MGFSGVRQPGAVVVTLKTVSLEATTGQLSKTASTYACNVPLGTGSETCVCVVDATMLGSSLLTASQSLYPPARAIAVQEKSTGEERAPPAGVGVSRVGSLLSQVAGTVNEPCCDSIEGHAAKNVTTHHSIDPAGMDRVRCVSLVSPIAVGVPSPALTTTT